MNCYMSRDGLNQYRCINGLISIYFEYYFVTSTGPINCKLVDKNFLLALYLSLGL